MGALREFEDWSKRQQQEIRTPLSPKKVSALQKKMPAPCTSVTETRAPPPMSLKKPSSVPKLAPVQKGEEKVLNLPTPEAVATGSDQENVEAARQTPIKRIGALRRSPLVG